MILILVYFNVFLSNSDHLLFFIVINCLVFYSVCCGGGFYSRDCGLISGRDRYKYYSSTAKRSATGVNITGHLRRPYKCMPSVKVARCGTLKNSHCSMVIGIEYRYNPSSDIVTPHMSEKFLEWNVRSQRVKQTNRSGNSQQHSWDNLIHLTSCPFQPHTPLRNLFTSVERIFLIDYSYLISLRY